MVKGHKKAKYKDVFYRCSLVLHMICYSRTCIYKTYKFNNYVHFIKTNSTKMAISRPLVTWQQFPDSVQSSTWRRSDRVTQRFWWHQILGTNVIKSWYDVTSWFGRSRWLIFTDKHWLRRCSFYNNIKCNSN